MVTEIKKLWYIFLDIDGVLDDETYFMKCYNHHKVNGIMSMHHFPFNPESLYNLMLLIQYIQKNEREVRIILSSTWRLHDIDTEIVKHRLAEYGLSIYGKTDNLDGYRGEEVLQYLNKSKDNYEHFIILDDDKDFYDNQIKNNLVKTEFMTGFTNECLMNALLLVNSIVYK